MPGSGAKMLSCPVLKQFAVLSSRRSHYRNSPRDAKPKSYIARKDLLAKFRWATVSSSLRQGPPSASSGAAALGVLGHLAGIGADRSAAAKAEAALEGHWFAPHYAQLAAELEKLWSRYGAWSDLNEFTAIGEIAKNVMIDRRLRRVNAV
jgi:hypothetical protein